MEKPVTNIERDNGGVEFPGLSAELNRAKEYVGALLTTTRRSVSSMPIVVNYLATIPRVRKVTNEKDEIKFITTRWVEGNEAEASWKEEHLDAYKIRDEFLTITEPRQALDFLRETGEFLPGGDSLSWEDFRRWQRLAEVVMEHQQLTAVVNAAFSGQPTEELDPSGELKQMLLMLTGIYPHTYFDGPQKPVEPDLAHLRRAAEVIFETPRGAESHYRNSLESIKRGQALARQKQTTLETWFRAPPRTAYSIEFAPKNRTTDFIQNMQRGGAIVHYVHPREDLFPALVIWPTCTLQAIAAAIYAERIAGIQAAKCPGCGKWFEIEGQKTKAYCTKTCRERVKKRRNRTNHQVLHKPDESE